MTVDLDSWQDDEISESARRQYEEMKASGILDQLWLAQQAIAYSGVTEQLSLVASTVASMPPIQTDIFRFMAQTMANVTLYREGQFDLVIESMARASENLRQMVALTIGASQTFHATYAEMLASLVGIHETLAGVGASFLITAGEEDAREIAFQRQIELVTEDVAEEASTLTEESAAEILHDVLSAPRLTEESSIFVEGQLNWSVRRGNIVFKGSHQFTISSADEKDAPQINRMVNSFVQLTSDGSNHLPVTFEPTMPKTHSAWSDPRAATLADFLNEYFNEEELQDACRRNNIDPEQISAKTRKAKAQEIVDYYFRYNGSLDDLITWCKQARPKVPWPFAAEENPPPGGGANPAEGGNDLAAENP